MRIPIESLRSLRERFPAVDVLTDRVLRRGYPLDVDDQRRYAPGFVGNVFVWDIDKTYLKTRFSSLQGLARIPLEFAVDKQAIPGMPEVLRGLRRGPGPGFACAPLYFVSASPPQLRKVVEHKMQRDGVEYDGTTFKDWLGAVMRLTPWRLTEHVGFKVCALLTGRIRRPGAVEYLFGDDAERDAWAFHLYARLIQEHLPPDEVDIALADAGVRPEDRHCIHDLMVRLGPVGGRVGKVFIHLEQGSPPTRFAALAPLVVPVRGGVQLALALLEEGLLGVDAARQASDAVRAVTSEGQVQSLAQDAVDRGIVRRATWERWKEAGVKASG
jgi:hypothetical protein